MTDTRLVADVGGTHIRLGLTTRHGTGVVLAHTAVFATAGVTDFSRLLLDYWQSQGAPPLRAVAAGVAGPVEGTGAEAQVTLTNGALRIAARDITARLSVPETAVVNDFVAVAAAAGLLAPADLVVHAVADAPDRHPTLVMGPGTGLGAACTLANGSIVAGEGGHAQLAPPTPEARPVWQQLWQQHPFLAAEHVLCGSGLVTLYRAVCALRGLPAMATDAAAVWQAQQAGDAAARETLAHFTAALGSYAGDLALIFGAQRVLLAGGILPRWGQGFDAAAFRRHFEAKEPGYCARLAAIPSATIVHPYPALIGLGGLAL